MESSCGSPELGVGGAAGQGLVTNLGFVIVCAE